ncbi:MAG: GH32 C-terminal domain-containing protein, partial [Lachnospiraceae bacterium]|nr:GH32 C-terminal domain-containing protein [Lachnospiraceae bacterium]
SAEIFVNDGESVITTTMYTDQNADSVSFYADGKAQMDIVKYNLD